MSGEADPNAQLLTLHLHPAEQGESFSLDPQTYRRLASACLSVHSDLMTIRKLNNAEPGCIVDLYGSDSLLKAVSLNRFLAANGFLVKTQYETSTSRALPFEKRPLGRSVRSNLLFL